jgi:putative ABC transport system substrate-binding protein
MPVRRRAFMMLAGSAVAGAATGGRNAARAQQSTRRVGVLMNGSATEAEPQSYLTAFVQGLRQLGWVEGQNLRLETRWNAGDAQLARI